MIFSALSLFMAIMSALAGCGYLAMIQKKHCRPFFTKDQIDNVRTSMRLAGSGFLIASFLFCSIRDGLGFAVLLWPLILGAVSIVVAMLLVYRPQWLRVFIIRKWRWQR